VSRLRASQASATRRLIVDAAAQLFVEQGFGRTTIDAIAARAGVGRNTVFTSVGGKVELLKLALDWATVGDDEPVPLSQRPEIQQLAAETDPDTIITAWVGITTGISARLAALSAVLPEAAGVDDQARALWQTSQNQRIFGARAFVDHLANHHGLRSDLTTTEAADLVWLHSDPAMFRRLVLERGWTPTRFTIWLQETITQQLRGNASSRRISKLE
jgi:AcrR family transcriptional regulator